MNGRPRAEAMTCDQPGHPAAKAWAALGHGRGKPERVQVIKEEGEDTGVYRLSWIGVAGAAIIAKRAPRSTAEIERRIYEELFPTLPLAMPRYHGFVEEAHGESCWLFLEEIDGERYRCYDAEHRIAAARWLGVMNISMACSAVARHFPRRRPEYYRGLLQTARQSILSNFVDPRMDPEDRALLEKVIAQLEILDARWGELAGVCEEVPDTLVHGDFNDNNVYVRADRAGPVVLPIDWGRAGWGVPAEDISTVDITAYWSVVRDHWPALKVRDLKQLANVGKIFRCLMFLDCIAPKLDSESIEQPMHDARNCEFWLDGLIRETGWKI